MVKKVAVVGATGYTGVELIRLILQHPELELSCVTSRAEAGRTVQALFPALRKLAKTTATKLENLCFVAPDPTVFEEAELVFFATPHAAAMHEIPSLLRQGKIVIDLSADFRLQDVSEWETWYGVKHACPEIIPEAVYGLPEVNRAAIRTANLIANPGCYPTAVQLGLLPLLKEGIVDPTDLVADCKSGVSGAGRGAKVATLHCETSENFKAYGVAGHRHWPEIQQGLNALISASSPASSPRVSLTFVPHLVPMKRGIEATLYANLMDDVLSHYSHSQLQELYHAYYVNEPFVDLLPEGDLPETASVTGANSCRLSVFRPMGRSKIVVSSVIDNLVKGAAGQAIQNMNIRMGWEECLGLSQMVVWP